MRRCQRVHDLRHCPVNVGSPQTKTQRDQVTRIINFLIAKTAMAEKESNNTKLSTQTNINTNNNDNNDNRVSNVKSPPKHKEETSYFNNIIINNNSLQQGPQLSDIKSPEPTTTTSTFESPDHRDLSLSTNTKKVLNEDILSLSIRSNESAEKDARTITITTNTTTSEYPSTPLNSSDQSLCFSTEEIVLIESVIDNNNNKSDSDRQAETTSLTPIPPTQLMRSSCSPNTNHYRKF